MLSRVRVQMVTVHALELFKIALQGLTEQTFTHVRLQLIDNASTEPMVAYAQERLSGVSSIRNPHNKGVGAAQNQGVQLLLHGNPRMITEPYVVFLATDVVLDPACLECLVAHMDAHPEVGMVGPYMYKLFEEQVQDESLRERVQSDHFASAGQVLTRGMRVVQIGAGEVDDGRYSGQTDVFAPPAGCVLVRTSALVAASLPERYLDPQLHTTLTYVELAWRMHALGFLVQMVPSARAYAFAGAFQTGNRRVAPGSRGRELRDWTHLIVIHATVRDILTRGPWMMAEWIRQCVAVVFRAQDRRVVWCQWWERLRITREVRREWRGYVSTL